MPAGDSARVQVGSSPQISRATVTWIQYTGGQIPYFTGVISNALFKVPHLFSCVINLGLPEQPKAFDNGEGSKHQGPPGPSILHGAFPS